jgi:Tfp pilus assembly protein PilO
MTPARLRYIFRRPPALSGVVLAAISILALSAVYFALWQPARLAAATAEISIERLRGEIAMLEQADRLAASYAARLADVESLEAKLKTPTNDPEFIRNLEALASRSGAAMRQVSSRPASEDRQRVRSAMFEFQVSGRYASVKLFLVSIQALPEFVALEQVLLELGDNVVRARVVIKRMALQG